MARGSLNPRQLDYSQVGTAGRRTGITLNQGQLDEHGMEEIDGMFSSPEKSPAKLNGFYDDDSTGSEGMSMDEGNAPGPMDFLNGANHPRNSVLPPSTRSPAKRVNGSIRRSPVLRSSPEQEDDLMSPSPSEGKSLVAPGDSRQDPSPLTVRSVNAGTTSQSNARRNTKAQLAASEPSVVHDFSDREGDENADFTQGPTDFDSPGAGDDTVFPDEEAPEASEAGSNDAADEAPQESRGSPPAGKTAASKSTKKGPAAKTTKATNGDSKPARRGRQAKSRPAEDDGETAESRPAKKRKTADSQGARQPAENLDPELDRVVENYAQRSGPLKGRSLYILKKEDPTDTSSTHTRSGRVSIRPLAYWRNERCVYGDGEAAEGQRYPLSTIKEVVRTEELEPEKNKKGKRSRKTKSKKRQDESSDEDDEDVDQWEKEGGILHGYVPKWDPKTQNTAEEEILDIAYAPSGIETREVKDSTFRFAKLLSSSFIGSGVVELPPEGVKKPKNSKKMHMVFYVCHGRVQVSISDVQFSAGKGSVFQVPRGNYYSFANPFGKEARLFFTQGCVPSEGDESPPSGAKNAGPESEAETESGPSAPKTKAKGAAKAKDTTKAKETAKTKETAKANDSKARGRPKGKRKNAK